MTTKVPSELIADNAVGITQLNVSDGSNGQVLTTNGSGTLSFSTVSGTTINNNADNRVITGSGTANTLEGESTFTFDGTNLIVGTVAAGTSTATPVELNLGSTFADAAGSKSKMKLKLFEDTSSNILGFGISNAALEYHSNGVHTFYKDESEKMRLDSSGYLLLGTSTTPSSDDTKLVVSSGTGAFTQYSYNGGAGSVIGAPAVSEMAMYTYTGNIGSETYTERMRIDSSGHVGIGLAVTDTVANKLQVDVDTAGAGTDSISVQNSGVSSANHTAGLRFQFNTAVPSAIRSLLTNTSNGAGTLSFFTSSDGTAGNLSERMRIDSGGDLTVGTSSLGFHFDVSTQLFSSTFGTGGNLTLACTNSSGSGNGGEIFLGGSTRGDSLRNCIVFRRGSGTQSMLIDASGNVTIAGSLSKGSGSFKIDHPLESKKETHHLVHSFVEAPQADNIYRGKVDLVNGSATVNIDSKVGMTEGTFVALNTDVQCFTTNESDWDAVKGSVSGNILTISCQNTSSTATVSWMVIGERQDQHMIDTDWTDKTGKVIVEPLKEETYKMDLEGE